MLQMKITLTGDGDAEGRRPAELTVGDDISTTDVYTGDDFSAVFVEADDGSVAIANSDFSLVMEGQYLTADEAIAYMGAAANYIN